ncbi:glycosyltransferase family 4 protein [Prosthecobacter vanneervenii]|uniref:Glycosyltransferase involved in cell wall biosynthesis n=1 Tax=Prosthecobacter vanneervenii TaxID=48466 RepID=A0A7W7Y9R5_9BACT|nr:glycosyltransferase family 4 protein [Prosthecobacter vanneervenii]MBB5032227.1 glycosyltransferase involved in cell wall biosynthesis [Prosthecobacter vanneervenii]
MTHKPSSRIRPLIIVEAANPALTSAALVGWSCAQAISKVTDAHIVTEWRNRDDFLKAGMVEGRDFTAINNRRLQHLSWSLASKLSRKGSFSWSLYALFSNLVYPFFERKLWHAFRSRLEAGEFDLVHRVLPLSPTTASWIAPRLKKIGVPFVLGPLNGGVPWPKGFDDLRKQERDGAGRLRTLHRFSRGLSKTRESASAILAASRTTLREIPSQLMQRVVFMPENAVDLEKFPLNPKTTHSETSRPLRISFVGRLVALKGVDMLLTAAAPLVRSGSLHLDIIGDGPERERLQKMVADEGIAAGVSMDGWVPHAQLGSRLRKSDLFVFPSIREFGGGVVLEAMALGIPAVVLDHGGPPELVPPGTGYVLPMTTREDIVSRIRQLLTELKNDPAQLKSAGELAQAHVRKYYTWEAKATQILEVYRWVLGLRSTKPDWGTPMGFVHTQDSVVQAVDTIPESLLVPGHGF